MFNFLTTLVLAVVMFLSACTTPMTKEDRDKLLTWTKRIEATTENIAQLSESEAVRKWAGLIEKFVEAARKAQETGEFTEVQQLLDEIRNQKPLLIEALKAAGLSNDELLAIVTVIDLALIGIEEAL